MTLDDKPDPCTAEAREMGCTCSVPHASSYDLDPPEPKIDRHCPVHGYGEDPDDARQRKLDDANDFPETDYDD